MQELVDLECNHGTMTLETHKLYVCNCDCCIRIISLNKHEYILYGGEIS